MKGTLFLSTVATMPPEPVGRWAALKRRLGELRRRKGYRPDAVPEARDDDLQPAHIPIVSTAMMG